MEHRGDFLHEPGINTKLQPNINSLGELNVYLNLHFTDNREAGAKAGISPDRVRQIRIGYGLPQTPKIINKIADGWGIDRTKLALLFERERRNPNAKC